MKKFGFIFILILTVFKLNGQTPDVQTFQNFTSSYKNADDVKAGKVNTSRCQVGEAGLGGPIHGCAEH